MRKAQQLHTAAMQFVDRAIIARGSGDFDAALGAFREALARESNAARLTREQPSRSILFRSAANLAIECGELGDAEELSCLGLIGHPPDDIAEELRHTLDRATFARHLRLNGIKLGPTSVQLAVSGPGIGYGDAPEPEIMSRVDAYRKLVSRSANRMRGVAYTDAPTGGGDEDFQLFLSTPRAASFAVTLRVGARDAQSHLAFDVNAEQVVTDVLENLERFDSERDEELRRAIPNADYRRNFVALARRIAPDGSKITTVGFTRVNGERDQQVAMRRPRASTHVRRSGGKRAIEVLEGRLDYADNRDRVRRDGKIVERGQIILSTAGREHRIAVPRGVLADIVRPNYGQLVRVRARKRSAELYEFVDFD